MYQALHALDDSMSHKALRVKDSLIILRHSTVIHKYMPLMMIKMGIRMYIILLEIRYIEKRTIGKPLLNIIFLKRQRYIVFLIFTVSFSDSEHKL